MNLTKIIERETLVLSFTEKLFTNLFISYLYIFLTQTNATCDIFGFHLTIKTRQAVPAPIDDIVILIFTHKKFHTQNVIHLLFAAMIVLIDVIGVWLVNLFSVDKDIVCINCQSMLLHILIYLVTVDKLRINIYGSNHREIITHTVNIKQVIRSNILQYHLKIMLTDFLFLSLQVSHLHQYILSLSLILTVIDDELKKVRIPCHYRLNVFSCIGGYKYQL